MYAYTDEDPGRSFRLSSFILGNYLWTSSGTCRSPSAAPMVRNCASGSKAPWDFLTLPVGRADTVKACSNINLRSDRLQEEVYTYLISFRNFLAIPGPDSAVGRCWSKHRKSSCVLILRETTGNDYFLRRTQVHLHDPDPCSHILVSDSAAMRKRQAWNYRTGSVGKPTS